jgi:DNA-binding MarR family transcriptional regulator
MVPISVFSVAYRFIRKVEYLVVALDDAEHKARLSLRQADILAALAKDEELSKKGGCVPDLQTIDGYEVRVRR